jgi:hypothetical protein
VDYTSVGWVFDLKTNQLSVSFDNFRIKELLVLLF